MANTTKYKTSLNAITIEGVEFKAENGIIELPDAFGAEIRAWVGTNHLQAVLQPEDDGNAKTVAKNELPKESADAKVDAKVEPELPQGQQPYGDNAEPFGADEPQDEDGASPARRGRKAKEKAKAKAG